MLEHFGVTEETWREGGRKDRNFLESESPLFVGRAVAALAGIRGFSTARASYSARGKSDASMDSRTRTADGPTGARLTTIHSFRRRLWKVCGTPCKCNP